MSEESPPGSERGGLPAVGTHIRDRRQALDLSVRELARRVGLSASLISQIERGKATPSVATLYAITTELGMSLDELFSERAKATPSAIGAFADATAGLRGLDAEARANGSQPDAVSSGPVVRPSQRKVIQLHSGVRWELLTPASDRNIDFLFVDYEPGGASCEPGVLMRHAGREYGYVLSGTLDVTVEFETYRLKPGDSISFDSTIPHRLATAGDEPVHAIWFVVGRSGDSRLP
ncbi:MAG: cupin domain-containing protein [Solirubrobacterales bacterium]|nr:cupin domain-containing protein [Solirubrobacterales bacterium]